MNQEFCDANIAQLKRLSVIRKGCTNRTPDSIYDLVAKGELLYPGFASGRFMNFGYWRTDTRDRNEASINLMDKVMVHVGDHPGNILDVACGLGATTREVSRWCPSSRIYGINLTEVQILVCRENAPDCKFLVMDAAQMAFSSDSFDTIICIEAAFHFQTRETFLRECLRILRPGGCLVLTDLLWHRDGHSLLSGWLEVNFVPSLAHYEELVRRVGFSHVTLEDITEVGQTSYLRYMFMKVHDDWMAGKCDYISLLLALGILHRVAAVQKSNVLCVARK
jgi:MPBQ/MSBQ methyltransferase